MGIEKTNFGCWCVPDFFNIRPDDGVSNSSPSIVSEKLCTYNICAAIFLQLEVSNFHYYAKIHATVIGSTFLISTLLIVVCVCGGGGNSTGHMSLATIIYTSL